MSKRNVLTIILDSVFVVAFNILFFVNTGTSHTTSIWICYGFLHFAYLMVLLTPLIESKGKTSYVSKLTTYSISLLYFLLTLFFAFFIFFYNNMENQNQIRTNLVISILTILTAIYFVLLISNILVNDSIANKQARHDIENDFIKMISAKAKYIESITNDVALKNKINNLYYTIHSSPIKTSPDVALYESKILELLEDLEGFVASDSVAASEKIVAIEQMLNKRNFMLKARG